jgi:putative serine protease PepD
MVAHRIKTKGITMKRIIAISASLAAAAGIGAGSYALLSSGGTKTVVRQVTVAGSQPAAATSSLSVTDVYNRTSKGVVELTVSSTGSGSAPFPFGGQQSQQAQGSGFVYDNSGDIITNAHVVEGANTISVRFANGASYKARLVGTDPSTDLAVVKVDAPATLLDPLELGDSSGVQVGEGVVAIGSPFGLEETVTSGIVSALHREMTAPNNFTIADSIQTDAAINHGNSGGPLLDLTGEVIGVNSQIESDSGDNAGVGFAVPSNTVKAIVSQLISSGKVQHAYLGVGIATASNGVRLSEVRPGTPAAQAGLKAGDVVTAIDGTKVTQASQLGSAIDARQPSETVSITFTRAGKSKTVSVKLAQRPS